MESHIESDEQAQGAEPPKAAEYDFRTDLSLSDYLKNYSVLFAISGTLLYLDQITKDWVRANLSLYESFYPVEWLEPLVRIINAQNTGAAFGIFKQGGGIFTVLAIVVALVIAYYFPRIPKRDWLVKLALGVQLGGALGNLYDRLFYGAVTDFIAVGSFPVFNVADSSISVGTAILILAIWLTERREKAQQKLALQHAEELEVGEQA